MKTLQTLSYSACAIWFLIVAGTSFAAPIDVVSIQRTDVADRPGYADIIVPFDRLESLSAFASLDHSGAWKFSIQQASAVPKRGAEAAAELPLGAHAPEPGSAVLLALGLLGLTVLSSRKHIIEAPRRAAPARTQPSTLLEVKASTVRVVHARRDQGPRVSVPHTARPAIDHSHGYHGPPQ